MKKTGLLFCCFLLIWTVRGEDGYQLWLRYKPVILSGTGIPFPDILTSGIKIMPAPTRLLA